MANVVQCSGCGTKLKAPENSAGKKIRCPKCQAVIAIPAESAPAPNPSAGFVPAPTGPGQRPASPSSYPGAPSGPVPAPTLAPAPVAAPASVQASAPARPATAASAPAPAANPARPEPAKPAAASSPAPGAGLPQISGAPANPRASGLPNIQTGESRSAGAAPGGIVTGIAPTKLSAIPGKKTGKKSEPIAAGGRPPAEGVSSRSKMVAGLLGIFLGAWGVHRFYLGYTQIGIIQIVVTLCTCVGGAWGFVEGIMILVGSFDKDADGLPLQP